MGGKSYTAGQIRGLIAGFPEQIRKAYEGNPERALNYIFMLQSLAAEGRTIGLDKKSAYVDHTEFSRLNTLAQAELARYRDSYHPTPEEEQKFYGAHPDRWKQAKFKAIYVAFSNAPPPVRVMTAEEAAKSAVTKQAPSPLQRTEAEAKARVDGIYNQLASGGDFSALAQKESDDKTSAAKGGDYGVAGPLSPYPEALKKALFALKPGQVSEVVRQPSGFYILKLDSVSNQPLSEVRAGIAKELSSDHFNDWIKGIEERYKVDVVDQQYFAGRPPR